MVVYVQGCKSACSSLFSALGPPRSLDTIEALYLAHNNPPGVLSTPLFPWSGSTFAYLVVVLKFCISCCVSVRRWKRLGEKRVVPEPMHVLAYHVAELSGVPLSKY